MSVDVSIGNIIMPLPSGAYSYDGWTTAVQNVTIATANGSNPRIDTVVAYVNLSVVNSSNPNNPGALVFISVAGTAASSPTAPTSSTIQSAIGAGVPWTPLANIAVGTSVTSIVTANITDTRYSWAVRADLWGGSANTQGHNVPNVADDTVALLNATQTFNNKTFGTGNSIITNGWQPSAATYTYSANNGNREFVLNTSANLTSALSPGMKFMITRGTVPPTQSMSFAAASSQYATNASPAGMTFGSAFTCEGWVFLNSYTGQQQFIVGRTDNTTGGFGLYIDSSGRPTIFYGASSAFTAFITPQMIPLNQWVHVAGVVSSVSSKTGVIYIDGTPATTVTNLSAATTLTQTSNLSVGAAGAGAANTFFNGLISEPRVWSAANSQSTIEANMAINLTSTTTNLVFGLSAGTFTDISGNSNTLTADGGASSTFAGNPFNALEFGDIVAVTSSSITVYTGNTCTIPNETLSSPYYSVEYSPYGLPQNLKRFKRIVQCGNFYTTTTASEAAVPGLSLTFTVPTNLTQLKITSFTQALEFGSADMTFDTWDGSVSGTQITSAQAGSSVTGMRMNTVSENVFTLTAGSHTLITATSGSSGAVVSATTSGPMYLMVEE